MIDISDGLAADAGHVCRSSGVGISLHGLPVAEGATAEEALAGGEDFELLFCAPPDSPVAGRFEGLRPPVRVGECTGDHEGLRVAGVDVAPSGWEHQL